MAGPGQLLDVPMQHIGQQIARSELNRIPAQRLADLRHRHTQQRAGIALAHLADFVTVSVPGQFLFQNILPVLMFHRTPGVGFEKSRRRRGES